MSRKFQTYGNPILIKIATLVQLFQEQAIVCLGCAVVKSSKYFHFARNFQLI